MLRSPFVGLAVGAHRLRASSCSSTPPFAAGPRVAAIQGNVPQGDKMARRAESLDPVVRPAFTPPHSAQVRGRTSSSGRRRATRIRGARWFPGRVAAAMPATFEQDLAEADKEFRVALGNADVLLRPERLEWDGAACGSTTPRCSLDADGAQFSAGTTRCTSCRSASTCRSAKRSRGCSCSRRTSTTTRAAPASAGRGSRSPIADGRAFTFGCLICYEDSDPYLARQYVGDRAGRLPGEHLERRLVRRHRGARAAPGDLPVPGGRGPAVGGAGGEHGHLRA